MSKGSSISNSNNIVIHHGELIIRSTGTGSDSNVIINAIGDTYTVKNMASKPRQ
jgi:hypothetical protein